MSHAVPATRDGCDTPGKLRIGSFFLWLAYRFSQLVWSAGAIYILAAPPEAVHPPKTFWTELLFLSFLVFFNGWLHSFVYGYATEEGLYYRRYFRQRFLKWADLQSIEVQAVNSYLIRLRHPAALSKKLRFAKSSRSIFELMRQVRSGDMPEEVRWIDRKIFEARKD